MPNYYNHYDTVYNATYNYIGNGSYFNQADLLADVDAYNLYNMEGTDSLAERFLVYYYGGKYLNRFTDFIGEQNYADIYNRSERMITMVPLEWFWPIKKVDAEGNDTDEDLILTETQIEAICDAYTTYIIDQTINE